MIDIQVFQTVLLIVCVLALLASTFIFTVTDSWAGHWLKKFVFRTFAAILGGLSLLSGALLIILK